MTNYREILRLCSQGISQRGIASSCQCSRNTVSAVIKRADEIGISWPFQKEMSNGELQTLIFPEKDLPTTGNCQHSCRKSHSEITNVSDSITESFSGFNQT